jgi:hypothetical protein
MRRLKQHLCYLYLNWKVKRWVRLVEAMVKCADVRYMKEVAEGWKTKGVEHGYPELVELGKTLDEQAEKIILRRIGFKK